MRRSDLGTKTKIAKTRFTAKAINVHKYFKTPYSFKYFGRYRFQHTHKHILYLSYGSFVIHRSVFAPLGTVHQVVNHKPG